MIIIIAVSILFCKKGNMQSLIMTSTIVITTITCSIVVHSTLILIMSLLITLYCFHQKRIVRYLQSDESKSGKSDYTSLNHAFIVTIGCSIVTLMACMFSDSVGTIVEVSIGSTPEQIASNSVMAKLAHHPHAIILGIIILFIVSYTLLRFLNDGFRESGFFRLPKKVDY